MTPPAEISLSGVTAYDPNGSGGEHDEDAGLATDGNPDTFWRTENYRDAPSFGKPGVGLVLDAGSSVRVGKIGFSTDTPGFVAQIKVGDSPSGPFRTVSGTKTVGQKAIFTLTGAEGRYYLIWITRLGTGYRYAHVNEVDAV